MRILATIAAPSGIEAAIRHNLGAQGRSWAGLFQVTGLTAEDWAAFVAALNAVNPDHFLKFTTAAGLLFTAKDAPVNAVAMGTVGQSFGPQVHSAYGDLK